MRNLIIGLDVGSTTVKGVVVDVNDNVLWRDYQRHDMMQGEKVLEFLTRIELETGEPPEKFRIFITGSGSSVIAPLIGARFVQEVNAVSHAVEKLFPEVGSVIELGGQDAKIIIFKKDTVNGQVRKIPTMNDKCAGGTGTVIDRINAKLGIPPEELCNMRYNGVRLHSVAGKCGVFAETDINSLQKLGVPAGELIASLFEAIVEQNLNVLTRGNTLLPDVLLLGGPNSFLKGMVEAWKYNITKLWKERGLVLPSGKEPEELIKVPENALYFAALGAIEFGRGEDENTGLYKGISDLQHYITTGRQKIKEDLGNQGLAKSKGELEEFLEKYKKYNFTPATFFPGEIIEGFLGIDGGSTSTKGVLLDRNGEVLLKAYQLSKGNPISDTREILESIRNQAESAGASIKVLGVGTTGYAKDILKDVIGADVALVETVAHTQSALHLYDDIDVICDVGGQDIKIMLLKNRQVKDFKLNTQCSAGNGYFLQSTAESFGIPVDKFAEVAFSAETMPVFGYGCAVFLQSDIVDFQRQGWKAEEILAALSMVLPKNIWLYVAQIPNLSLLGTNFILQGGTQNNLAAVKAQVDFIESRFKGKDRKPIIKVHKHCGECGAIGAAIEAIRLWDQGQSTSFIGFDSVAGISYKAHRNEKTRCLFCKNKCLRSFIDIKTSGKSSLTGHSVGSKIKSKIPLEPGARRLIVGNSCEKGLVEEIQAMKSIKKDIDSIRAVNPNLSEIAGKIAWQPRNPPSAADPLPRFTITGAARRRIELMKKREKMRIGIPRALNMFSLNPFFSSYFESLGIKAENLVYSDFTSEKLYKKGVKRGAIDPCYPSKVAIAHVHNLMYVHHGKNPLSIIFFPLIGSLTSYFKKTMASQACPTITSTPDSVCAAFVREKDIFAELGIQFQRPYLSINNKELLKRQMFQEFKDILGLSTGENDRAVEESYRSLENYIDNALRSKSREILEMLEAEDRIGIVLLGRPYHNDPGINHGILENFQKLGYPILTQDFLPTDDDILERLFGAEVRRGVISHPLEISDVWKNSFSENSNRKIWAAKFTARHPNLVALELSNFKCGQDAPIYNVIEEIVGNSGTPYFCLKDIDENKPTGSIKLRVETIDYFLKRYREEIRTKKMKIDKELKEYENALRKELRGTGSTGNFNIEY